MTDTLGFIGAAIGFALVFSGVVIRVFAAHDRHRRVYIDPGKALRDVNRERVLILAGIVLLIVVGVL